MNARQVGYYVALALIWGVSFALIVRVVAVFGWVGAVSLRAFAACLILGVLAFATRRKLDFGGAWRPLAIVGSTTVAGQLLGLSYAAPRIGTAMAAIIVGTIPLFSMVIGQAWGIEKFTGHGRIGLVLGIGGIVLLVGFPSVPFTSEFAMGCAASLFGSLSAAIGSNVARHSLQTVGSWEQTIGAFLFGGIVAFPMLLMVPVPVTPTLSEVGELFLLAGLCSCLTYIMYFRLVAEVGATIAISVEFAVTLVAVAIGSLLLGERLTTAQLIGGATISAGCALVLNIVPVRWGRR